MSTGILNSYNKKGSFNFFEFLMSNVSTNTESANYSFDISPLSFGTLAQVYSVCSSEDYDFSIRDIFGVTVPSVDEIYRSEEINKYENNVGVNVPFVAGTLYGVLTNNDLTNNTGTITILLGIHG